MNKAELTDARRRLQNATEALNDAFKDAELALEELQLGAVIEVALSEGRVLSWRRLNGEWCLAVQSDGQPLGPLASASRKVRIEASRYLEALLDAAASQIDAAAVEAENAVRAVQRAATEIRALVKS